MRKILSKSKEIVTGDIGKCLVLLAVMYIAQQMAGKLCIKILWKENK